MIEKEVQIKREPGSESPSVMRHRHKTNEKFFNSEYYWVDGGSEPKVEVARSLAKEIEIPREMHVTLSSLFA